MVFVAYLACTSKSGVSKIHYHHKMAIDEQIQPAVQTRVILHRWLSTLRGLAIVETILGIAAAFLCIIEMLLADSSMYRSFLIAATGFLIFGIIGMIAGVMGMMALASEEGPRRRRLAISHFVLCILSAIFDFLGVVDCIMQGIVLSMMVGESRPDHPAYQMALAVIAWMLVVVFLAHMICSILSTGFTCNNWCCGVVVVESNGHNAVGTQGTGLFGGDHLISDDGAILIDN